MIWVSVYVLSVWSAKLRFLATLIVVVPFWIALINPLASLTVTALGSSASAASAVAATLLSARLFALRNYAFWTALFTLSALVETSVFASFTALFKSEEVLVSVVWFQKLITSDIVTCNLFLFYTLI